MKIRHLFARPTSAAVAAAIEPSDARARLREAHAERAKAVAALAEARAVRDRVFSIVAAAEHAEATADRIAADAADATRRWATAGARGEPPESHKVLLDAAVGARRSAEQARLQADGAKAAMPEVGDGVRAAEARLAVADDAVRAVVVALLVESTEADFAILHKARTETEAALARVTALRAILKNWGGAHPWGRFASLSTADALSQRIRGALPEIPIDSAVRALSNDWAELGSRLLSDPDAAIT